MTKPILKRIEPYIDTTLLTLCCIIVLIQIAPMIVNAANNCTFEDAINVLDSILLMCAVAVISGHIIVYLITR